MPGASSVLREATIALAARSERATSPAKAINLACETLGASDDLLMATLYAFNAIAATTTPHHARWWGYAWMQFALECASVRGDAGIAPVNILLAGRRLDALQER